MYVTIKKPKFDAILRKLVRNVIGWIHLQLWVNSVNSYKVWDVVIDLSSVGDIMRIKECMRSWSISWLADNYDEKMAIGSRPLFLHNNQLAFTLDNLGTGIQ